MEETIRSLIDELNRLTRLYECGKPEVSDKEWDDLYFKLKTFEEQTGIIYPDSPTQKIIFEQVSELKKIKHTHPMLSLDKTKDLSIIKNFIRDENWVAMFKLDGLSCSIVYINGKLDHAETRGNGEIGEDITHNIYTVKNVPLTIKTNKEVVVVDGEILCTLDNFENFQNEYKNPRNFAAGSIRLLDAKECAARNLRFVAWDFIQGYESNSFMKKLEELDDYGFTIVPAISDKYGLNDAIETLNAARSLTTYPIDGYVFRYDNQILYDKLGATAHHFMGAMAYKFYDESHYTKLRTIQWTMGRTGVLTPVAVFDPIEIEGTTVERASLHNVSVMKETLGDCAYVGEPLKVTKMNMIIPQVVEAGPKYDYEYVISHGKVPANNAPEYCPICHQPINYKESQDGVINAYCSNHFCEGKFVNRLIYFAGKKGLDIKGISRATFEKLVDLEWIKKLEDIFFLYEHREDWIKEPGFGAASVDKILKSIEESRHTTLNAFIASLGIPLVGTSISKELIKYFKTYEEFRNAVKNKKYSFTVLKNFGKELNNNIKTFDYTEADSIAKLLFIEDVPDASANINDKLNGKNIVITGKLIHFKNRAELKDVIEKGGGKVKDSVNVTTDVLINNDTESSSSKNKTAQRLGIPILSEADFMKLYLEK